MKKQDFFSELGDYLEIDNLKESSNLELTSMSILSVIALVDENFDKQLNASDLKALKSVSGLMNLIGVENFAE
jgi:acyl carrier protein